MEDFEKTVSTEEQTTATGRTVEETADPNNQIDELVEATSELAGILKSSSLHIDETLTQANHFYRFDVAKGEKYVVENNSPTATLIIYISETGDESYSAEKTECITVSPDDIGIFDAPENALYIGFYNNASSVDVQISHVGHDTNVESLCDVVLSKELHIERTLPTANHFYRFDIKKGEKYVVENNSSSAGIVVYTSQTGNPSYAIQNREYGSVNHGQFLTFFAEEDAPYIGFYNNSTSVDVIISHAGLDDIRIEVVDLQNDVNAMSSTFDGYDQRITTSKSEAIAESKSYTDAQILSVSPTNILWNQLSASLQNRIDGAGGTITNASDGEDLTVVNSMLKFANKNGALMQFGGKSRVFLRKNIVNGQNVLSEGMINATNTIYILQYDYTLNDQTVELGSGSTIIFYGGSIDHGTLDYSHGNIIPMCDKLFGNTLSVITNEPVNIAWYGKKSGDSIDDIFNLLQGHTVIIPVGNYICTKSGYTLAPNTMFIGEKVLNNDQTCRITFQPSNETKSFIIGINNNCGFKDITLWLDSTTYNKDFVRVDSAFWKDISMDDLCILNAQQYYIDNVYFYTSPAANHCYLATAFHILIRDENDANQPLAAYQHELSYRQHFKNVEIKCFSVGICVELIQERTHTAPDCGVWCNSLHFSDIDMWVRNNGFVLKTTGLTNSAQGRFIISNILIQPVGTPYFHYPYAFYAEDYGYDCMLDRINAWDNSKVAYVAHGSITLGQYMADDPDPLTVGTNGVIKTLTWTDYDGN